MDLLTAIPNLTSQHSIHINPHDNDTFIIAKSNRAGEFKYWDGDKWTSNVADAKVFEGQQEAVDHIYAALEKSK